MKKRFAFILAGTLFLAISVLMPSCKEEIYTDEDALAAMKEGLKYKNDLAKELLDLQLTNQMQIMNLQSQIDKREWMFSDSLNRIGGKTSVNVQVSDVTGMTTDMSGFDVTVNQSGTAVTLQTDANGLVVFPDVMQGAASVIVTKTGFVRTTGLMSITGVNENNQQTVFVPVFPTDAATAKIEGTLKAHLDLLKEEPDVVEGAIVSLKFNNVMNILTNPNSTIPVTSGLLGVLFDGGFMQSVKTGADGKYEFKIPKTKSTITYVLTVATLQKPQRLLFGDYPTRMDSIKLDTMNTWFGYYPSSSSPIYDNEYTGYEYDEGYSWGSWAPFAGVNISIDAPTGGQTPTAAADIDWVHNDSTLVTWSFTKFIYGNGVNEFTNITQAPKFVFEPNLSLVTVVTPTAGVVDITGGKLNSLYMTNGGLYKEWGRNTDAITPITFDDPEFKFFEQLSDEDVNGVVAGDTTYQTAIAVDGTPVLNQGKVKIPFTMTRRGVGYTAKPNFEFKVYLHTPATPGPTNDSLYTFTQADVNLNLLTGGKITVDTLVLPAVFKAVDQVNSTVAPVISTSKYNSTWQTESNYWTVTATASNTYKVDLLNGLKIKDGGLGYTTAPSVRIENYAKKQGTENYWRQTVATAATTIDAEGRIISIAAPVMTDNLVIQPSGTTFAYNMYTTYANFISVPADVTGKVQAYARAYVNQYGTITDVLLLNEDNPLGKYWISTDYSGSYYSGKGYLSTPNVKVTPVGKTSVDKNAVLKAVVNTNGRISNIIIVDGGKGYDVKNNLFNPDNLIRYIYTNGDSDAQYDIDMGSGYRGDIIDVWND